jgi:hypothetical protein
VLAALPEEPAKETKIETIEEKKEEKKEEEEKTEEEKTEDEKTEKGDKDKPAPAEDEVPVGQRVLMSYPQARAAVAALTPESPHRCLS